MTADELERDGGYIKHAYHRIITLGLAAHFSYIVIFSLLRLPMPAIYNAFSVLFYCVMHGFVGWGHFRATVACIHLEVCVFAAVCTLAVGWDAGTPLRAPETPIE